MILISHRGNINGKNLSLENHPEYIDKALSLGFDVEIDIWYLSKSFYLGHDNPEIKIGVEWLYERQKKLWIHCKNLQALPILAELENTNDKFDFNFFFHDDDDAVLTSKKFVWVYPGKQPLKNSIAVMPEINNDDLSLCIGVCSDNIIHFKQKNEF